MGEPHRRAESRLLYDGSVVAHGPLVGHVCFWGIRNGTDGGDGKEMLEVTDTQPVFPFQHYFSFFDYAHV